MEDQVSFFGCNMHILYIYIHIWFIYVPSSLNMGALSEPALVPLVFSNRGCRVQLWVAI